MKTIRQIGILTAFLAISVPTIPLMADEPKPASQAHTNRLAKETSPYLLLHAHNPVDWYPWGPEALEKAKRENKPIFLSVGYSSCHWCHVMERESFLDAEIAAFLNEHFVCVKVDREERPDVDSIYMSALQLYNRVTGSGRGGGWPMSMFLTPDCRPFFGGTYFPARDGDRGVTTGFLTLIKRVDQFWREQRERIETDAETLTKLVKEELDRRQIGSEPPDAQFIARTLDTLEEQFDPVHGGFGYIASDPQVPKFPEPSNLVFLLGVMDDDRTSEADRKRATTMLLGTLDGMAQGGIRDHLGGGFHRYSVDRFWRIPHFEKMLYDNAQLVSVYAGAFRSTGRDQYRRVVDEIMDFVDREMSDTRGAFYSAIDAESEGEEGRYYRWEKAELEKALAGADAGLLRKVYGLDLDDDPNFEDRFYVPQLLVPLAETAKSLEMAPEELERQLAPLRDKLLQARSQRVRPLTDNKILTSWNGLMIRGAADAGRLVKEPRYIERAKKAAEFALENLRVADGRLVRTHRQGPSQLNAYLDDYAFLVDGFIALYQATNDQRWLTEADQLTQRQIDLFWDETRGGFFFTSDDHESLIARGVDPVDGAEPSGNSVSAGNLLFLAKALDKPDYRAKAARTFQIAAGVLQQSPSAAPRMAHGLREFLRDEAKK